MFFALFETAEDEAVVFKCVLAGFNFVEVNVFEAECDPVCDWADGDELSNQLKNLLMRIRGFKHEENGDLE
jgi:hypothetical protein